MKKNQKISEMLDLIVRTTKKTNIVFNGKKYELFTEGPDFYSIGSLGFILRDYITSKYRNGMIPLTENKLEDIHALANGYQKVYLWWSDMMFNLRDDDGMERIFEHDVYLFNQNKKCFFKIDETNMHNFSDLHDNTEVFVLKEEFRNIF